MRRPFHWVRSDRLAGMNSIRQFHRIIIHYLWNTIREICKRNAKWKLINKHQWLTCIAHTHIILRKYFPISFGFLFGDKGQSIWVSSENILLPVAWIQMPWRQTNVFSLVRRACIMCPLIWHIENIEIALIENWILDTELSQTRPGASMFPPPSDKLFGELIYEFNQIENNNKMYSFICLHNADDGFDAGKMKWPLFIGPVYTESIIRLLNIFTKSHLTS